MCLSSARLVEAVRVLVPMVTACTLQGIRFWFRAVSTLPKVASHLFLASAVRVVSPIVVNLSPVLFCVSVELFRGLWLVHCWGWPPSWSLSAFRHISMLFCHCLFLLCPPGLPLLPPPWLAQQWQSTSEEMQASGPWLCCNIRVVEIFPQPRLYVKSKTFY